jgi:PKD repeat protein
MLGSLLVTSALLMSGALLEPSDRSAATSAVTALSRWVFTTVDSLGDVGNDTSIAIDSNDKVHMSYFDGTNGNLKYATNSGGSWASYTLDSAGIVGKSTSIAVDSADKVHISYLDWTNTALKYATNAGGAWAYYTVDNGGDVGLYTSIALDSNDRVHISYQDWTSYSLKYATNTGGSWTNQTIDSSGDVGYYTSIAIDSADNVHISYGDGGFDDLKYATNTGGAWTCYTVDSTGFVGYESSIAVDSNDFVHISYSDDGNANLKYATNAGGSWANFTLDDTSYVGICTSIAVDLEDHVHISYQDYHDMNNTILKYATNETGAWEYYSLENVGTAGYGTSIALDSHGLVHLGYKDSIDKDLRYAFGTERDIPALVADFDAVPASGQSELTVQFTSNVSGGVQPYVYSWAFGDGRTNSSRDPVHTYAAAGTYTVTLAVTDLISSSISVQKTIEVSAGSVEPIPEDDRLDLKTVFATIPFIALAVTSAIAVIISRMQKGRPEPEIRIHDIVSPSPQVQRPVSIVPSEPMQKEGAGSVAQGFAAGESRPSSVEQRLLKLREMRRKGLISEEEYDRKTDELLRIWR